MMLSSTYCNDIFVKNLTIKKSRVKDHLENKPANQNSGTM